MDRVADLNLIWKNTLSDIEIDLGKNTTKINFANSRLSELKDGVAKITLATAIAKETVDKRYYTIIQKALERQTKDKVSLLFEVAPAIPSVSPGPLFDTPETKTSPTATTPAVFQNDHYPRTRLNPRYTFANLIVGASNNFAHAAAVTISKNPGKEYNPFFIYGGVGVGKTHMMQAVGNELFHLHPEFQILYITAENFMNDLVASLQDKSMPVFKRKYRDVDVLLVDDIQFISKKEAMQDEFFHTFNSLFMAEKQIILTSDRPPEEIQVEDRLLSRLMGGLATDIQPPDLEMRMAIITKKLALKNEQWDGEVVEFLAARYENNIREVEGAMFKVLAQAQAQSQPVTLDLVKRVLNLNVSQGKTAPLLMASPQKVLAATSKILGIKQADILSEKRDAEFVLPRQIIMYLLRKECQIKFEEIARLLKRKDHTTIIHGVEKIEDEFANNLRLRQQILLIKKEVWG